MTVKKGSPMDEGMHRVVRDCNTSLQDLIKYHLRHLEVLWLATGTGKPDKRVYSRQVLELRKEMLEDIMVELYLQIGVVAKELTEIDDVEEKMLTNNEDVIYDKNGGKWNSYK